MIEIEDEISIQQQIFTLDKKGKCKKKYFNKMTGYDPLNCQGRYDRKSAATKKSTHS